MPKLEYAYEDPSGSFVVGQTPYGTYDNDSTFANRGSVYVYKQLQDSSSASATYVYQQTLSPGDDAEVKDDSSNQEQQFGNC